MPETSKFKSKSKQSASPSILHLSGSISSDNEGPDGEVERRARSSEEESRSRFWFIRKDHREKSKASQQKRVELKPQEKESVNGKLRSYDRSGSPSVSSNRPSRQHSQTKQKRPNSRFSLRNLIYGNPLFAQHFGQTTPGPTPGGPPSIHKASSTGSKKGLSKNSTGGGRFLDEIHSDTRSVMRDSLSLHGTSGSGATASTKECPLCFSDRTLDQFPMLRNCVHCFCLECLQTYVRIEIQEGRVNLRCPQCTEHLHPNDIESLIGDKNSSLLTLYESLMLRRILAGDPDIRWCPGPNCTFAVIAQGCASCPKLDCERPGCGYSFCYHCKAEWHPDQTCEGAMNQRFQAGQTRFPLLRSNSADFSLNSVGHSSEYKVCPRCTALIMKMDDGSCNHMTCTVCGAEFCWLCMTEINDLHYLTPSGCTFWGKKPWSRKKKRLWQLGTIIGAPVGIALLACISIPAMIIGIPLYMGRKIHDNFKFASRIKRNLAVTCGVVGSVILSPALAVLAVSIGVPVLLCYVYAVVPIALCRSEGCGISTSENGGVKTEIEEDYAYRPVVSDVGSITNTRGVIANPSIGEMSLGASLSLGSGCHLERDETETGTREVDRESASNTAMAGTSLTGSVASSYLGGLHFMGHSVTSGVGPNHPHGTLGVHQLNRLEVSADVHTGRKKFSLSSERLSETVSLSERSATVSLAEDAAFARAMGGNFLSYKLGDNQSVSSYRTTGESCDQNPTSGDDTSLRSLPMVSINQIQTSTHILVNSSQQPIVNPQGLIGSSSQPRSLSPVSCQSGDDLGYLIGGRKSLRSRRPLLDKQLSENSSLLSGEDATSERVRFDDNVSFIDDCPELVIDQSPIPNSNDNVVAPLPRIIKGNKLETSILPEETAEELAEVVSPEPRQRKTSPNFPLSSSDSVSNYATVANNELNGTADHVTMVSVKHDTCCLQLETEYDWKEPVEVVCQK